jgi:hypothetical protein
MVRTYKDTLRPGTARLGDSLEVTIFPLFKLLEQVYHPAQPIHLPSTSFHSNININNRLISISTEPSQWAQGHYLWSHPNHVWVIIVIIQLIHRSSIKDTISGIQIRIKATKVKDKDRMNRSHNLDEVRYPIQVIMSFHDLLRVKL